MANYDEHARWGKYAAIGAGLLACALVYRSTRDPRWAIGLGGIVSFLVFVFSIFPDTDHPQSIPYRRAVILAKIGILGVGGYFVYIGFDKVLAYVSATVANLVPDVSPAALTIGIIALTMLVAMALVPDFINRATGSHREWTHSWSAGVVIALSLASTGVVGLSQYGVETPFPIEYLGIAIVAAVLFGLAIHFYRDGILFGK
ncbi:hypothetical protein ACFQO4_19455 [Saliphagus sp. GCM10025334]|uniref:hypothetical protein n=1 Tax=Natronosalvus caseinilyticus TaxID=2953747 RepID=UPI0028ADA376|nr:hypothetical protein [Natronosalvus caseinilyticus]